LNTLKWSVRTANILEKAGYQYVADLVNLKENEFLKTKNAGRQTLREVKEILGQMGLSMGRRLDPVYLLELERRRRVQFSPQSEGLAEGLLEKLDAPLENLVLPVRISKSLNRGGIYYVGQLAQKSSSDLMKLKFMGPKVLQEIVNVLDRQDLSLD